MSIPGAVLTVNSELDMISLMPVEKIVTGC